MWTQVKRLKPGRVQPYVILLKNPVGVRLYVPMRIQHQMGDPVHIDLYVSPDTNQLLIQPVLQKGPTTRKFNRGCFLIPHKIWGPTLRKLMGGRKKVCVSHQLDAGNLRVDLRHAIGVEKQHRRGPKSARQ